MSFYVTLPTSIKNKGTISEISLSLAEPIQLSGNYQVALVEFIYNHSFKIDLGFIYYSYDRIQFSKIPLYIDDASTKESIVTEINRLIKLNIVKENYNKRYKERKEELDLYQSSLKNGIELQIKEDKLYPLKTYDQYEDTKIVDEIKDEEEYQKAPVFSIKNQTLELTFNSSLLGYLSFDGLICREFSFTSTKYHTDENPITIVTNVNFKERINIISPLYLYVPELIEWQYIGKFKAPLLRTIAIHSNEYEKIRCLIYDSPHYVDVKQNFIPKIDINIRDEYDEKVFFNYSDITLKLHFRKI